MRCKDTTSHLKADRLVVVVASSSHRATFPMPSVKLAASAVMLEAAGGTMPVVKLSRYSFQETIERLSEAIVGAGATLFASIDQSDAAARVGLELRPTTLLVFGNPKSGTGLMAAHPLVALDLPLKFLVWDDGGSVRLAYVTMSEIAERYTIDKAEPTIVALGRALETLSEAISTTDR